MDQEDADFEDAARRAAAIDMRRLRQRLNAYKGARAVLLNGHR